MRKQSFTIRLAKLTRELASKTDLLTLRTNMQMTEAKLETKVEKVGLELMGKILRLDRKFTIMFIILFLP